MKNLNRFWIIALIVAYVFARLNIWNYKIQVEELEATNQAITSTALQCGEALNIKAKETEGCTATVYTMGNAKEECDRLVGKAAEGLDTCMANVEFFKELAAYNESNLDTCLYDLRVERGQRTDGN